MPRALTVVLAVVAVEVLGLLAVAGLAVAAVVRGEATSAGLSAGVVVLALGIGALLAAAARAMAAGRRWGRAPTLTWQLLQLAVVVPAMRSAPSVVPTALATASLLVAVGLFWPSVVRHTTVGGTPPVSL